MAKMSFTRWDEVPGNLKTRTQLGRMGLRLAKGQEPVALFYSIYYHTSYSLYDVDRAVAKRKMSDAQRAALEKARAASTRARTCISCGWTFSPGTRMHDGMCRNCFKRAADRMDAIGWAKSILADPGAVILDTETTGLGCDDEIIEIAVVDISGAILLNTLIAPTCAIEPGASAVHGITGRDLANAPSWPDIHDRVAGILRSASRVVIYNAAFDVRMLNQTGERYGLDTLDSGAYQCAMHWYAQFLGDWSDYHGDYRWQPLAGGHRALGDCLATLAVIQSMAMAGG